MALTYFMSLTNLGRVEAVGEDELLDHESVGSYLVDRGVIEREPEMVRPLGGGVSNVVLQVEADGRRLVVKQALPRLRVAQEWLAKRERAVTEGRALRLASSLTPDAAPGVVDIDPARCVLVIDAAPEDWAPWKSTLLTGDVDPETAARLGGVLGEWHARTTELDVPHDPEAFDQLRLDPYHRATAARWPELAPQLLGAVDELQDVHECLVHGDFSPKNVLVAPGGAALWVIDFEVAHRGNPVFDVAFLLSHLVLKAVHRPTAAGALGAAAQRFIDAYRGTGARGAADDDRLALHVGCLLLARVDGKSPAEYLSEAGAASIRALAVDVLRTPSMRRVLRAFAPHGEREAAT